MKLKTFIGLLWFTIFLSFNNLYAGSLGQGLGWQFGDMSISAGGVIQSSTSILNLTDTPAAFDDGKYLKSHASSATWVSGAGGTDNLGDHTATEALKMAGYDMENGGEIQVDSITAPSGVGNVYFSSDVSMGHDLTVTGECTIGSNVLPTTQLLFQATLNGGGVEISTGMKSFTTVPNDCIITSWKIMSKSSGSITCDVWKDIEANHPPTNADSIAGTERPLISSGTNNSDVSLTSMTTDWNADDVVAIECETVNLLEWVQIYFYGYRD